tara:strand:- start:124 stop:312 length:189 start_codon:yes stop_codon:yes gene_type:complete
MKTFKELREMMVANAAGNSGGFGAGSDSKGPTAGYDLPFGGMIKRWYTAAKATSKRKKNERN